MWHRRRTAVSQSCPRCARSGKAPCKQSRQTGPMVPGLAGGQRRYGEMFETRTKLHPWTEFDSAPRLVGRIPTPSAVAAGTSGQSRGERGGYRLPREAPRVTPPGQGVLQAGRASGLLTTRRHLLQSPSKIESRGCLAVPADVAVGHRPLLYLSRFEHRLAERGAR